MKSLFSPPKWRKLQIPPVLVQLPERDLFLEELGETSMGYIKCSSFNSLKGGNKSFTTSCQMQLKYQQSMTDARRKKPLRFPFIDWEVSVSYLIIFQAKPI